MNYNMLNNGIGCSQKFDLTMSVQKMVFRTTIKRKSVRTANARYTEK